MPTPRMRLGLRGEQLARAFLEEKGYQIADTNYRCPWGELDIVAQDGDDLAFVEVRTRRTSQYGEPEESLSASKQQHLVASCQHYLQQHDREGTSWRIDLVCVRFTPDHRLLGIEHLEHAVQL